MSLLGVMLSEQAVQDMSFKDLFGGHDEDCLCMCMKIPESSGW